jgi:F-type H+-transporting ATPase subunit gamma
MKQLLEIAEDQHTMATIVQLTSAFEGLASMRIAQIKGQVQQAQQFFDELWHIYSQIRVDSLFRFGRQRSESTINKDLYIVITAEGGFSGDIDQRLISLMLKTHDPAKQDIIVIGHHGALILAQAGVSFKKYYKLPEKDRNINVEPLIHEIRQYHDTIAYYQAYISLTSQDIRKIELSAAVQAQGKRAAHNAGTISEDTYIFEPSTFDVIAHLERSMLRITLSQLIFESKLAQYASRFQAMSAAHNRADDSLGDIKLLYNRSKRALHDERLKETLNGLKKVQTA